MGTKDTRYLEKHQGLWRVVVAAPRPSTARLKRSLGTSSLREAQRRRWAVVAELKAVTVSRDSNDAEAWRAALAAGDGGPDDQTGLIFHDHLDRLPEKVAMELAQQVYQTPLDHHLPAFLASRGELRKDTRERHEAAVRALADWLKSNDHPPSIESVDRRIATRFVDDLPSGRRDPKRLALYWAWLLRRDHVTANPWRDLSTAPRRQLEPERPWTDAEALALLQGPCEPSLGLLMRVLGLTGARLDAVIRMEVKGDTDGLPAFLIFPPQKKELGSRTIPLHSHLREPLAGWTGWPWPATSASQRFTRYRRSVLGEDPPGRTRAVVNAHSWRRWFISKAERAGQPENVIAAVVGHRRPGLTFGRYSSGPGVELMRACVEAVKLPLANTGASH
jgi:hypothetical protein